MSDNIKISNLSFSYEKHKIYSDLSLEIESNKITFIMGNNGCGKTTLLKLITNILQPLNGDIIIKGKSTSKYSDKELSKIIAYVPQNIKQNVDFLVKDYLIFGRTPYLKFGANPTNDDYDIVYKYSEKMLIQSFLDKNFNELSGGQKQLITITRALIQETPIMLMDEPMSALDIGKQADFLCILKELISMGKTVILTSHNPNHALQIESNVCLIDDRKIIGIGKNVDVLNSKNIKKVYGSKVALDSQTNNVVFKI